MTSMCRLATITPYGITKQNRVPRIWIIPPKLSFKVLWYLMQLIMPCDHWQLIRYRYILNFRFVPDTIYIYIHIYILSRYIAVEHNTILNTMQKLESLMYCSGYELRNDTPYLDTPYFFGETIPRDVESALYAYARAKYSVGPLRRFSYWIKKVINQCLPFPTICIVMHYVYPIADARMKIWFPRLSCMYLWSICCVRK